MYSFSNNPPSNKLPNGVTEEAVLNAISASGYPLQTLVAANLRQKFDDVQEEWSYVDRDTEALRALDILGVRYASNPGVRVEAGQIAAGLALLIECKQSKLPYVFFLSEGRSELPDFPLITGLPKLRVTMSDGSYWPSVSMARALSLDQHPFTQRPPYSRSFSKCRRKSKELELSGIEPYNGLVMPLMKAMYHYEELHTPRGEVSFLSHLVIPVGIIDAPIVGVKVAEDDNSVELLPWVRVSRHETTEVEDLRRGGKLFAIDIVHKDFFETYLYEHLWPFFEKFQATVEHHNFQATVEHHKVALMSGKGRALNDQPRLSPPN